MRMAVPFLPRMSAAAAPCELKVKGEGKKLAKYVRCRGSVMMIHSTTLGASCHRRLRLPSQPGSVNMVAHPTWRNIHSWRVGPEHVNQSEPAAVHASPPQVDVAWITDPVYGDSGKGVQARWDFGSLSLIRRSISGRRGGPAATCGT